MTDITVMGIDLAKSVFQLHGVDSKGRVALKKRVSRAQLAEFVATLKPCLIGMEACGGAHHWARRFRSWGHEVRLMPPEYVKPYVKSQKNDANDAEAICEAVQRPSMRFVAVKTVDQQELLALHAIRARLVRSRTALVNEIRGLLQEFGIVMPIGISRLRRELPALISKGLGGDLTETGSQLISELAQELRQLDERISTLDRRVLAISRAHPVCRRLSQVPGVGPLTATAVMASTGDPNIFKNGRQFSAWLGLVPRQVSSGGKERLLGISKRGNVYLRTLLIHGARAVIYQGARTRRLQEETGSRHRWVARVMERRGPNRAAVALANKNARTLWAMMARDQDYREMAA